MAKIYGSLVVVVAALCGMGAAPYLHFGGGGASPATAMAQAASSAPQQISGEGEAMLFVLDPHMKEGRKGITLVWLPQPLEKYCIGKTHEACATIDYCIRTTNKDVAMCKNLSADVRNLPPYPVDVTPRRMLSVTLLYPMTPDHGRGSLMKFFEGAAPGSLDRLSTRAQVKARVKLTRTWDDDNFEVLEVVGVPAS